MSGIKPPGTLSPSEITITDFELWYEAFTDYVEVAHEKADDAKLRKLFLAIGGLEIRRVVKGLTLADNNFSTLIAAVKKYFQPVRNIILERHKFFQMHREHDEVLSNFLVRLRAQAELCDFHLTTEPIKNQLIRDQFIRCVNDKKITESLLSCNSLTLNDAIEKAEGLAQAAKDATFLSEASMQSDVRVFSLASQRRTNLRRNENVRCYCCKQFGHFSRDCPENEIQQCSSCKSRNHASRDCYKNQKCKFCSKFGHTSDFCRRRLRSEKQSHDEGSQINGRPTCASLEMSDDQITESRPQNAVLLLGNEISKGSLKYINVSLQDGEGSFLIDTGASFSVISNSLVKRLRIENQLSDCDFDGIAADKSRIRITKSYKCTLNVQAKSFTAILYVVDTHVDGILGMDLLPLIGLHFGPDSGIIFTLVSDMLRQYVDIFNKPLKESCLTGVEPRELIKLDSNASPKQSGPLRLSKPHQEFLKEHIEYLLEQDIIEESHSSWRHNPVIVTKSDGTYRMTVNYKPVNSVSSFDAFPFPIIDDLLSKLSGARFFSRIDFSQFYYQLPLIESDREKTAFQACGRLFHFKRCPFGLKNAVANCSRLMASVFKDIPNILLYLDDGLIYGRDKAEHDRTLEQVFQRIKDHNLSLNMKKCEFEKHSTVFLGHLIEDGAVKPDPDRLKPMMEFPIPQTSVQLQRFLGLATYYSKYIANYSGLSKVLYDKLNDFDEWTPLEKQAFLTIKSELAQSLLVIPDPKEILCLRTDASGQAIAAVLETVDRKPVYFCSRSLNSTERNKDIVELEALAIYWSILRCKTFLLGRHFKVLSDHRPLQYLFNKDHCNSKLSRWRLKLQEFDFEVVYCRGEDNVAADCLSRLNSLDFEGMTVLREEQVLDAQRFDDETRTMIKAIEGKYARKPEGVSDGLWKMKASLVVKNDSLRNRSERIFVPYSLRHKALTLGHGCHLGRTQTLERIRNCLFWPGLTNEISAFIDDCRVCSLVKPKFVSPESAPVLTKSPMETVACDFVGPLSPSSGFRYLLVIIDVFSRYPVVYPLRDLSTQSLIQKFGNFFSLFGFPDSVLSDQGSQFEAREFQDYLRNFGVRKLRTNAWHPSGNGLCERFNKTLKTAMLSFLNEHSFGTNEWVRSLNQCLLEYRTSVHSSTKQRPVDLFFSFNAHGFLPGRSRPTRDAFRDNLCSQMRNKKQIDQTARNRTFLPGTTVLVRNLTKPKFGPKGDLAKVVKQIDFHSVEVRLVDGGRAFRCSTSRLSHVPESFVPEDDSSSEASTAVTPSESGRGTGSGGASPVRVSGPERPRRACDEDGASRSRDSAPERPRRMCGPPQFYGERYFY